MKNKTTLIIASLAIVVVIVGGVLFLHNQNNPETLTTDTPVNYKDGTYTAEGDYEVHIGQKHISVKVTLKNNLITAADVTNQADDPTSKNYQNQFISGYKAQVIGKNISDIHLTKVSGSSLTPSGFNDALTKIEAQAKM